MPEKVHNSDDSDEELFDDPDGYYIENVYVPPPPPPPKSSINQTGTRLVITHIENINFKSYAGTQILGPFHKCFTAIVGPNGSGKSNVIDSMLFVFGFRASKLRLKKLTSLIHNSDTYSNFDFCSVIVHFALIEEKEGQDFKLVENSQFQISRTVHKNNQSYYKIDNKIVHFKEVSVLLQSHGIDLRYNRFLILQGEVEQIALMKPKAETENDTGMLEFLEDIIGSQRLKAPIDQLTEKKDAVQAVKAEKIVRVEIVEKEKNTLERAKNEAVAYLKGENQLTFEKNKLYQIHKAKAQEEVSSHVEEHDAAKRVHDDLINQGKDLEQTIKTGEDKLRKIQDEIKDAAKQADDFKEVYTSIESKDQQLRAKAKHTKEKSKKLNKQFEEAQKELQKLEAQPEELEAQISEYEKEKSGVEEAKMVAEKKLSEALESMKSDTISLQEEKDKLEGKVMDLQSGVNEAKSNLEIAESELNLLLSKERTEKAKLEQLKMKYETNISDLGEKEKALKEYNVKIPESRKKVSSLTNELQSIDSEIEDVASILKEKSGRCAELKSNLNSSVTRNAVLQFLMDQKKQGNLKGVYGRLGDLGAIDKKYDVAISTACGPLDNIVTDTMDTAIKCTELLRKHDIGSATFIALDKMDKSRYQEKITTPENVPRLFDLIKVKDEDVLPAFYFAIRDTLVANDLDQATKIGLEGRTRFRVVTLEGKMVEVSGAMSGGGRPSRGRMGTSIVSDDNDVKEIQRLEEQVDDLKERYEQLKSKRELANAELKKNVEDLEKMESLKPKFEMELNIAVKSQENLRKLIEEQEKLVSNIAPPKEKIKELEKNVRALQELFDGKDKKQNHLRDKIKQISDKIEQIFESKVGKAKKKIEELTSQFTELGNKISKTTVALNLNGRNMEKIKDKLTNFEKEIESSKKLIEELASEMKTLEEDGKAACEKYQEALKLKEELEDTYKLESSSLKKLENNQMKLKAKIMDAKNELDSKEVILKDKSSNVSHWQAKIDELNLNEIEDEEYEKQLPTLSDEEIDQLYAGEIEKEIESMKKSLSKMKPNMAAIAEFKKKEQIWIERKKKLDEVREKLEKIAGQVDELKRKRLAEFKEGFFIISRKLKEIYRALTSGGDADLEWKDSLDPFSEGINFSVRPNKKSWKCITKLSGGEKTLSSLALIFAVHHFKPSPLYVMDEIDAALDFKNVSLVGNYVKQKTQNTQFLIISLRYNMYELADRLVGIYKTYNATKSVTLDPSQVANSQAA